MRNVLYRIRVDREESFLHSLLPKLIDLKNHTDSRVARDSLATLASLCHNNYVVVKMISNRLTDEERKSLFIQNSSRTDQEDLIPVQEVLLKSIQFSVNSFSLLSQKALDEDVSHFVNQLWDAVQTAYTKEDILLLQMFTDFLQQLRSYHSSGVLRRTITVRLLQQIFLVLDFSEGSNDKANNLMLQFVRHAIDMQGDGVEISEASVKMVMLNLESVNRLSQTMDAILLLQTVVDLVARRIKSPDKGEALTESQISELKFTFEQVVAPLCECVTISKEKVVKASKGFAETYAAVMEAICAIASIQDWHELVSKHWTVPDKVMSHVKEISSCVDYEEGSTNFAKVVTTKMFKITCAMKETEYWEKSFKNHFCQPHTTSQLIELDPSVVKAGLAKPQLLQELISISETNRLIETANQATHSQVNGSFQRDPRVIDGSIVSEVGENGDDFVQIGQVLDNVTKAAAKMKLDENVADLVELGDFRLGCQKRQIESLRFSLAAADERIASMHELNLCAEQEKNRLAGLVKSLSRRLETREKHMSEIRSEYANFETQNSHSLREAKREIEETSKALTEKEAEAQKLLAKNQKLRDNTDKLKESIEEYREQQQELQSKLQQENKINQDLTIQLGKRDEKLKKKEMRLDEERSEREALEKERDTLKKDLASLKSLTNQQKQLIAKKDKQIQEHSEELESEKAKLAAIFNMAGARK